MIFITNALRRAIQQYPLDDKIVLPSSWEDVQKYLIDVKKDNWGKSKFYEEYFGRKFKTGFSKIVVAKVIAEKMYIKTESEIKKIITNFEKLLKEIWDRDPKWK